MKMMNVILVLDAYCVANTPEAAIATVLDMFKSGELGVTTQKALELHIAPIAPCCRDDRAIVADDVSDADFEKLRGKTVQQAYDFIEKKQTIAPRGSRD